MKDRPPPVPLRTLLRLALLVTVCLRGFAVEPDLPVGEALRPSLTLSFVGDIMHHMVNAQMPDYDRLYDAVRGVLSVDDLSFANIEFPVDPSRAPDGYPIFNGSVEYVEAAIRGGFDVFALANNHTYDLGASGVDATREVFRKLGERVPIYTNGIRESRGADLAVTEILHRGWRIGFISITSFSNVWGSGPYINLVNYLDATTRTSFLDLVRSWSEEYDLLIVSVHAGVEYVLSPVPHKVEFFRDLSDAGADIVWTHHPHVLQPWERRGGGVIIYSAGNFVSGQRRHQSPSIPFGRWAPTGDTAVFQVLVEETRRGVESRLVHIPVFTTYLHPEHGLVLRRFDEMLLMDLPLPWRAFYFARYAFMRRFTATTAFAELGVAR